ncbi:MAG: pantoate--beta-alanine ligase [Candidatus Omnitrophota bacterium]|jgi:pantoate--beta-alanine ligase
MRIVKSIRKMQELSGAWRKAGRRIGFVPTMGALHNGHLSLLRRARRDNDRVVISVFVNPTQFGPGEDFNKYPRDLSGDAAFCRKAGADVVFYPGARQMYPSDYKTYVEVWDLSNVLCGNFRPGHFRGVATVLTKLFNIVQPDSAYFGQKDAQQAVIARRMARDLNMPLRIEVMPTVRDKDGLAMSSRNNYLSPQERKRALVLSLALKEAERLISRGRRYSSGIIADLKAFIRRTPGIRVQYLEIVDPDTLRPLVKIKDKVLVVLAVHIGKTRLIDNIVVKV